MGVHWVNLNTWHASVPPPVVQRQDGDGENTAGLAGMIGQVDPHASTFNPSTGRFTLLISFLGSPEGSTGPFFYQRAQAVILPTPFLFTYSHPFSSRRRYPGAEADALFHRSCGSSFYYRTPVPCNLTLFFLVPRPTTFPLPAYSNRVVGANYKELLQNRWLRCCPLKSKLPSTHLV